jgi:hypothetical protein
LGLFDVTLTTTLGYNSSHIQLLLDHVSVTVVCILHFWPSGIPCVLVILPTSVCCRILSSLESDSYVTSDGQLASLSWNKAPIWDLRPDFYYRRTVAGLLMWGALSDESTDLSFKIAAGPHQHSHSRVRVPWDSRPYFTVSDSKLSFSSPPTTRSVTVEEFDPAFIRGNSSVFTSALLGLLYSTVRRSRRHLVQGFCFAFQITVASVLVAAGTDAFRYPLPGKLLCETPLRWWGIVAFRRRVTIGGLVSVE